jgi:GntR family transcriptional regulator, transcriptional repressor for pyruvate dehydrogenase complex
MARTITRRAVGPAEQSKQESVAALLRGPAMAQNAFEVTVERLGSSIKMGLFGPAQRLPSERRLAEMMGVSRTTIREAIRVLTVQGILTVRRGRSGGTFVAGEMRPPSVQELHERVRRRGTTLREILDHRLVVEVGVAELAAERATAAQRREIADLVVQMKQAEDDFAAYRRLDTAFHLLLGQATGAPRLAAVVADVHAELSDLMSIVPYSREACVHSTTQHRRIARAIVNGQPSAARSAMREHVGATASFLRGLLG